MRSASTGHPSWPGPPDLTRDADPSDGAAGYAVMFPTCHLQRFPKISSQHSNKFPTTHTVQNKPSHPGRSSSTTLPLASRSGGQQGPPEHHDTPGPSSSIHAASHQPQVHENASFLRRHKCVLRRERMRPPEQGLLFYPRN